MKAIDYLDRQLRRIPNMAEHDVHGRIGMPSHSCSFESSGVESGCGYASRNSEGIQPPLRWSSGCRQSLLPLMQHRFRHGLTCSPLRGCEPLAEFGQSYCGQSAILRQHASGIRAAPALLRDGLFCYRSYNHPFGLDNKSKKVKSQAFSSSNRKIMDFQAENTYIRT